MAKSWHQPVHTNVSVQNHVGHTTSVDLARNQQFRTSPVNGAKRARQDEPCENENLQYMRVDTHLPAPNLRPPVRLPPNRLQVSAITRVQISADGSVNELPFPRSTPSASQHPLLSLAHPRYGLPPRLVANFESLGVKSIYPWQSSCFLGRGILGGEHNLIYTAPTGGGKSLVADVLLLKRIIENPGKKGLLVLPYVALVQEKLRWLRRVTEGVLYDPDAAQRTSFPVPAWKAAAPSEIRIAGFFGGSKSKLTWSDCDIAVCTIEKANSLVNEAIEDGKINELKAVVLDELHMIDDEHRGYVMELMITKLRTLQADMQVVGMSATLSNPKLLADWIQAKFYVSKYRPIPIEEYLVYDNSIYPTASSKEFFRTASQLSSLSPTQRPPDPSHWIAKSAHQELANPIVNAVVSLAVETASNGYGALVFCSSRQGVQTIASLISEALPTSQVSPEVVDQRMDVLASLQALPNGFENTFSQTILAGVGFHHAGLTIEERELVAEAYDSGILKVMVATCSLAAGINLPARRVILHGARMGRDLVGPAMLRQMRGRAGRKGKDEIGETFLCCQKTELEAVAELLKAELPAVVSCLTPEKRGVKRAILEVIATRLASSYESLQDYIMRSLLWQIVDHNVMLQMLDMALVSLLKDELIQKITDHAYTPTTLGSAIVTSSLTPEDGLFVHSDLRRALSNFVMDSEFHILYLFTPIPQPTPSTPLTSDIPWTTFRNLLDSLDDNSIRALRLIGVSPATVNQMANSGLAGMREDTPSALRTARVYRRAYTTFALRDLCNEVPIHTVSLKYDLPRGTIQNLAQSCHGFAAGMIKFCQRMASPNPPPPTVLGYNPTATPTTPEPQIAGFSMLAAVLEHMVDRLRAGARADLLEMAQVTFVKGRMARLLYENGIKGLRALSEADPKKDIVPVMMMVSGWKAKARRDETAGEGEERRRKLEEKLVRKAEILVASAGRLWERECLRSLDEE